MLLSVSGVFFSGRTTEQHTKMNVIICSQQNHNLRAAIITTVLTCCFFVIHLFLVRSSVNDWQLRKTKVFKG